MTKTWTKIEDYLADPVIDFEETNERKRERADLASRHCMFPDCATDDERCAFGCPFKSDKGLK